MIDVQQQIDAVARTVGSRVLDAGDAHTVTISQVYDTEIADLWDACTSADRIARWYLPVAGDLREGGHFQLEGNASGTIERCDPPSSFFATWEYGGEVNWIEVRLEPVDDGTRLEIEHIVHVDDARWEEFGPGAVGVGWDLGIVGLALHLASGEPVDPAAGAAWAASDGGRSFIALSSDAWAGARIAAGADAAVARAAAARTTAAYTGG